MSEGTQHVTFTNMQRELEASQARHLDLAKRYDVLAARLAEVEAENAELVEKLKAGLSRDDRTSLSSLFGYDLGVEEGRAEGQAERDRLAQELEDERAIKNQALGHLRDVTGSAGYVDRANAMGEALSFLARFPREGDEG